MSPENRVPPPPAAPEGTPARVVQLLPAARRVCSLPAPVARVLSDGTGPRHILPRGDARAERRAVTAQKE